MPTISWKLYAMAGAVLASFAAAWFIQGNRWDNDVLSIRNQYREDQLLVEKANVAMLSNAIAQRDAAEANAAKLSSQLNENLKNAKANNKRLADAVASGAVRLLVEGKASSGNGSVVVSKAGGTGSAGNVVQFELSAAARQSYNALRDSIATDQSMIEYYKDYINQQCVRRK